MASLHYHDKRYSGYLKKDYLRFINSLLKEGKRPYRFS
jgi:hypothetical protein